MAEIKTAEQRKADLAKLLQKVESMPVTVSENIPQDIVEVCKILSGMEVKDIFAEKYASIFKFTGDCRVVVTTKTKKEKTLYEVFSTGAWGLVPLLRIGNRMLKCKITLMLE